MASGINLQDDVRHERAPVDLPPDLARLWHRFASLQISKGRRDIGVMVEAAMDYLFEKGLQRFQTQQRTVEELEAFVRAVTEEVQRVQDALDEATGDDLSAWVVGKTFRIQRRTEAGQPPSAAVLITSLEEPLKRVDEARIYQQELRRQLDVAAKILQEQQARLMQARDRLKDELMPYSPLFYDIGTAMVAEVQATERASDSADPSKQADSRTMTRSQGALSHRRDASWSTLWHLTADSWSTLWPLTADLLRTTLRRWIVGLRLDDRLSDLQDWLVRSEQRSGTPTAAWKQWLHTLLEKLRPR